MYPLNVCAQGGLLTLPNPCINALTGTFPPSEMTPFPLTLPPSIYLHCPSSLNQTSPTLLDSHDYYVSCL